jgi:hypothetical protein
LDGNIPVLATVKDTELGAEFLDQVRKHKNAEVYMLDLDHCDEIYEKVLPVIQSWNHELNSRD